MPLAAPCSYMGTMAKVANKFKVDMDNECGAGIDGQDNPRHLQIFNSLVQV